MYIAGKNSVLRERKALLYAVILGLFCWGLNCITKNLYADVDNFTISVVTNRLYDIDNYCIYLHPLLCWIIGRLSDIFPQTDAFLLIGRLLILGSLTWLFFMIVRSNLRVLDKLLDCLFLIFTSTALSIWNENYTIQAAFFMFAGVLTLCSAARKNNTDRLYICSGAFFICCGVMWRLQAALLFVPFVLLEIVAGQICSGESRKNYWKNIKRIFGSSFLLVLILLLSRTAVQMSGKYSLSVEYDSARVKVQDYPMKQWEMVEKELVNITQKEYEAAQSWVLLDTETIDKDFLLRVGDIGETTEFEYNIDGVINGLERMVRTVWTSSKEVWIFLGVFFFCFLYAFSTNQLWWRKIECMLVFAGTVVIILYYIILGRAPLRVWESVIFAAISVLGVNMVYAERQDIDKKCIVFLKVFVGLILCVGILKDISTAGFLTPQLSINSRARANERVFEETFEGESLYFWTSWHSNITLYYMEQGKLPSKDFFQHNLSVGDWNYGQVYFENHLKEVNAYNPVRALVERKQTYFVGKDNTFLLEYLREHYGNDIEVKQHGEINAIPIWSFQ